MWLCQYSTVEYIFIQQCFNQIGVDRCVALETAKWRRQTLNECLCELPVIPDLSSLIVEHSRRRSEWHFCIGRHHKQSCKYVKHVWIYDAVSSSEGINHGTVDRRLSWERYPFIRCHLSCSAWQAVTPSYIKKLFSWTVESVKKYIWRQGTGTHVPPLACTCQ